MKQIITIVLVFFSTVTIQAQIIHLMLVTGGHSYDTISFSNMFDQMEGIQFEHVSQPEANKRIAEGNVSKFHLLVFYDIGRKISDAEKQGYLNLLEQGKPMLFLHHSLLSYPMWPEFEKIIGGKYFKKDKNSNLPDSLFSSYHYNVSYHVKKVDSTYSATKGISDFLLFDEAFENYKVGEFVTPLYTNDYNNKVMIIGWENRYKNSKIIYFQPGHDRNAFDDKNYRKVLLQLINYLKNN